MGLIATNYNGTVSDVVYKDVAEGNEVISKMAAYLETGVRSKSELAFMKQTADPIGAYVASPVTGDITVTTDRDKRDLVLEPGMIYEEFDPNDYIALWDKWGSVGPFSQLKMNPLFMRDVLELTAPGLGANLSKYFWQGDKAGTTFSGLTLNDGIIVQAAADANTIKPVTSGVITSANIIAVIQKVIDAIPDKDYDNQDYVINMSTADWRILQRVNTDTKKTNDGVLEDTFKNFIEEKRIQHFVGLPKDYIVATKSTNAENSNLVMGFWFDEVNELRNMKVDYIANNSEEMFMKLNIKFGAQYRYSENLVLYEPA